MGRSLRVTANHLEGWAPRRLESDPTDAASSTYDVSTSKRRDPSAARTARKTEKAPIRSDAKVAATAAALVCALNEGRGTLHHGVTIL
jgi:hypothetical protein